MFPVTAAAMGMLRMCRELAGGAQQQQGSGSWGQQPALGCLGTASETSLPAPALSALATGKISRLAGGESPAERREGITGTQEHPCSSAGIIAFPHPWDLLLSFSIPSWAAVGFTPS